MIKSFSGEYQFLSNFYPVEVVLDGITYPTVENAYQAAKTLDLETRKEFLDVTPGFAKRLGQRLEIRSDWGDVKLSVMTRLNEQKYMRRDLREKVWKMFVDRGDNANEYNTNAIITAGASAINHQGRKK